MINIFQHRHYQLQIQVKAQMSHTKRNGFIDNLNNEIVLDNIVVCRTKENASYFHKLVSEKKNQLRSISEITSVSIVTINKS
jgi:hypothetical protein